MWYSLYTSFAIPASVEHSICPGSLPDAFLEPYCLKRPTDTHVLCEVIACKTGFRMSYILNVIYRRAMEPRSAYVMCANGTWVTQHEHNAFGVNDICLPEGTDKTNFILKAKTQTTQCTSAK